MAARLGEVKGNSRVTKQTKAYSIKESYSKGRYDQQLEILSNDLSNY